MKKPKEEWEENEELRGGDTEGERGEELERGNGGGMGGGERRRAWRRRQRRLRSWEKESEEKS